MAGWRCVHLVMVSMLACAFGCKDSGTIGDGNGSGDVSLGDTQTGDSRPGDIGTGDDAVGDAPGGDAQLGDPWTGDPSRGDPLHGDAQLGDPWTGDPSPGDPLNGDASGGDVTAIACPPPGPYGPEEGDTLPAQVLLDCNDNPVDLHDLCGKEASWIFLFVPW